MKTSLVSVLVVAAAAAEPVKNATAAAFAEPAKNATAAAFGDDKKNATAAAFSAPAKNATAAAFAEEPVDFSKPPHIAGTDKLHFFDFDNAKMLYQGDWSKYKKSRPHDNDCSIAESDNWKGAQQCVESWECRGARLCERGGWCSGFDGCEGSPLPTQAPGLSYTH